MVVLSSDFLDVHTPEDVDVRDRLAKARRSTTAHTECATSAIVPNIRPTAKHGFVAIGDSLVQGVTSGAVHRTDLSFPAMVAEALGIEFSQPTYDGPLEGLPVNLESVVRRAGGRNDRVTAAGLPGAAWRVWRAMDRNEDYWERGGGRSVLTEGTLFHNLGIYGWDIRDALSATSGWARSRALAPTKNGIVRLIPENDNDIAAASVLGGFGGDATQLDALDALGRDGGIDTLFVALGANNALGTVVKKRVRWTTSGYNDIEQKDRFTIWRPVHFAREYAALAARLDAVDARRVILTTVPHVTVAPFAKGIHPGRPGEKWRAGSRYFPFYVDPWITEATFNRTKTRHLTHQQVRAIDSAIDQYNDRIERAVGEARGRGKEWYLFDLCAILDGLAVRRYGGSEQAARGRNGVQFTVLPEPLANLDARWFESDSTGRTQGGLFGLDGIHPTTAGYAVIARELLWLLASVGAAPKDATIDLHAALASDTLNSQPPASLRRVHRMVGLAARRTLSRAV
jgi:hypothetical protein